MRRPFTPDVGKIAPAAGPQGILAPGVMLSDDPGSHLRHLHRAPAAAMAVEAVTPASAARCGFAGGRGFLHPELTQAATAEEAAEVGAREFDAYLGSNRSCEIGLTLATGKDCALFVYRLEQLTRRPA